MLCFSIILKINIDKPADGTADSGVWTSVHVHSASSYPVKVGGFHWFDSVLHYVSIRANALDAITLVIWEIQRNCLRADLIRCRRRLFGAAEHFMALLLGYWGNNVVIPLDGWGLARWIFIGVSMEKEWSGRQCLGVCRLGSVGSALETQRRSDLMQPACTRIWHTTGIRKLQKVPSRSHPSYGCRHTHTPVFPPCGAEARGFLMHLCVQQRPTPLGPPT